MTSFYSTELYNPAIVLVLGLLTFAGVSGLGTTISGWLRLDLPTPWRQVTALLLGIQTVSLAVQGFAMAGHASRIAMMSMALCLLAAGAARISALARHAPGEQPFRANFPFSVPLVIAACSTAIGLLVAMAPSSKIDEVYYHMLLPGRILADGALVFYREPWEAAVLPQMAFQIFTTPLHAIGFPDAGNVVSWALGVALLWFGWAIIREHHGSPAWAALWMATLCAGIYPLVFHVTSGAHAMGALALAAATVAFAMRRELRAKVGAVRYAALLSMLAMCAGSTKITLLPLVTGMLMLACWPLLRAEDGRVRAHALLALAAPWLLFFMPIALWTWAHAGAPFGPMLSEVFPASVYEPDWTRGLLESRQEDYASALPDAFMLTAVGYSPLLFFAMIGALACTTLPLGIRMGLTVLLAFQIAIILLLLIPDVRYLGGFHYGLVILLAAFVIPRNRIYRTSGGAIAFASAAFLLPWLGAQIYYAQQFFPVSLGLRPKEAFYLRFIAFYEDYKALDRILPADGVLLVGFRTSNIYAPRPVYLDAADLPANKAVYVMSSPENADALAAEIPGFRHAEIVYRNAHAVTGAYRAPGQSQSTGPVLVIRMQRR